MYEPGQVLTVFRSRLRDDAQPEYGETATAMAELARTMPGYVEHKAFTADDGERVTVVTFADAASQQQWREHVEHRAAQRRGVQQFYASYSLQVAEVTTVSSFP